MSKQVKVDFVNTKPCAIMAYQATLGRLVVENSALSNLHSHPRKYFVDSVAGLKGTHRDLALQAMIIWIHWGDLMSRTINTGEPDEDTSRRMLRSKKCAPAGVRIKSAKFVYRCENYACPMCWFIHVYRRLSTVRYIMNNIHAGPLDAALHVKAVCKDITTSLPTKADINKMYELNTVIKKGLPSTGALSTVRIIGEPGAWRLASDTILLDATASGVRRRLRDVQEIDWGLVAIQYGDGPDKYRNLLLTMAECMAYPIGLFHPQMESSELQTIFVGDRTSRSRATGVLSKCLNSSRNKAKHKDVTGV